MPNWSLCHILAYDKDARELQYKAVIHTVHLKNNISGKPNEKLGAMWQFFWYKGRSHWHVCFIFTCYKTARVRLLLICSRWCAIVWLWIIGVAFGSGRDRCSDVIKRSCHLSFLYIWWPVPRFQKPLRRKTFSLEATISKIYFTKFNASLSTRNFFKAHDPSVASLEHSPVIDTVHLVRDQLFCGQWMPDTESARQVIIVVVIVTFFCDSGRWNVFKHVHVVTKRQK